MVRAVAGGSFERRKRCAKMRRNARAREHQGCWSGCVKTAGQSDFYEFEG